MKLRGVEHRPLISGGTAPKDHSPQDGRWLPRAQPHLLGPLFFLGYMPKRGAKWMKRRNVFEAVAYSDVRSEKGKVGVAIALQGSEAVVEGQRPRL